MFMNLIDWISQPWHWSVSGILIALTMFILIYLGRDFGVSSTLRTLCSIGGAGRWISFFDFNWSGQLWNLVFVLGAIVGGGIASTWLASPEPVQISTATEDYLENQGVIVPDNYSEGTGFLPGELFNFSNLYTPQGFILMVIGGFLIGFGTRWAGGCTSGHAISGLSNLQLPSLIAVIGFFLGGLIATHLLMPLIFML